MKFLVKKEEIFNGIRIVANVAAMKSLQPVLANILIETVDDNALKLTATDFDLTISTTVDAKVEKEGKITLPAKKLNDIVSRLSDKLITFELEENTNSVNIQCDNTKYDIIGISASEFPNVLDINLVEENSFDIDMKPFTKAIRQASFAAANFETNNLLSGVVCDIKENILEMASTDGNRLARVRENISNLEQKTNQLIIPSKNKKTSIPETSFGVFICYTINTNNFKDLQGDAFRKKVAETTRQDIEKNIVDNNEEAHITGSLLEIKNKIEDGIKYIESKIRNNM